MPGTSDNGDIEPSLSSGQAGAIQDLADQAKSMGDRAVALQRGTQNALNHQIRRWRRTTTGLAVAIVLLLIAMAYQISVSEDNKEILKDVEQLVEFVNRVEERNNSNATSEELREVFSAVFEIRRLVCSDGDPIRKEACDQLNGLSDPSN